VLVALLKALAVFLPPHRFGVSTPTLGGGFGMRRDYTELASDPFNNSSNDRRYADRS
jgi:hypothetical protein